MLEDWTDSATGYITIVFKAILIPNESGLNYSKLSSQKQEFGRRKNTTPRPDTETLSYGS